MAKILQRFGDGYLCEMTEADLKKDIVEGTEDAAAQHSKNLEGLLGRHSYWLLSISTATANINLVHKG